MGLHLSLLLFGLRHKLRVTCLFQSFKLFLFVVDLLSILLPAARSHGEFCFVFFVVSHIFICIALRNPLPSKCNRFVIRMKHCFYIFAPQENYMNRLLRLFMIFLIFAHALTVLVGVELHLDRKLHAVQPNVTYLWSVFKNTGETNIYSIFIVHFTNCDRWHICIKHIDTQKHSH